jgi:hypothetical protein
MLVFFYGTHLCLIKFALSLRPPICFVGNFRLFLTCLFHLIVSHMICFYSSLLGLFWMLSHALLLRSKTCSDTNLRLNFRTFYTNDGMVTNSVCLFFFIQWTAIDYNGRGARLNISIQKILETRTERNILGCFSYYNFKILPAFVAHLIILSFKTASAKLLFGWNQLLSSCDWYCCSFSYQDCLSTSLFISATCPALFKAVNKSAVTTIFFYILLVTFHIFTES